MTGQICLSYFLEGQLVIISVKLFLIVLTIGFREDALGFLYRYIRETDHATWRSCLLTDQIV